MTIRVAQRGDLQHIVDIYNETIAGRMVTADTEPTSVEQRLSWFDGHHPRRPLFVYESEGEILAWLSFKSFYGRPAYDQTCEISIYIATRARGKGLGHTLMVFAQEHAPNIGVTTLLGFIFSHNTPSINLFKKHGYSCWGELPAVALMDEEYYNLTIMGKHLY